MRALIYMTKRTMINRLKKAIHKPVTYLYFGIILLYVGMLAFGGYQIAEKEIKGAPFIFIGIVTLWTIYAVGTNLYAYSKRKGLLFKQGHTHFVFPSPISPKTILVYTAIKNFLFSFIIYLILAIVGSAVFQIEGWKMVIFFLVGFTAEVTLECSLVIIFYGNEMHSEIGRRWFPKVVLICLLALAGFLVWYFYKNSLSLSSVIALMDSRGVQAVPVIGWNIAFLRLILLGPAGAWLPGAAAYLILVFAAVFAAVKMKCMGGYYEEAAKFADDYVEFYNKNKKGEVTFRIGTKKKWRRANIEYRGTGAKAIFYRQVLEYKKERFFILGYMSLVSLIVGIVAVKIEPEFKDVPGGIVLFCVILYLSLLTSGYLGKWGKELKSPYLYMIPDTPFRKLWYSTLMEHFRNMVDGAIASVVAGTAWKLPWWQIIFCILLYTLIQAVKIYVKILIESCFGDTLGNAAKEWLRLLAQYSVLGVGIAFAALAGIFVNLNLVYPIFIIYSILIAGVLAVLASARFETMEQLD